MVSIFVLLYSTSLHSRAAAIMCGTKSIAVLVVAVVGTACVLYSVSATRDYRSDVVHYPRRSHSDDRHFRNETRRREDTRHHHRRAERAVDRHGSSSTYRSERLDRQPRHEPRSSRTERHARYSSQQDRQAADDRSNRAEGEQRRRHRVHQSRCHDRPQPICNQRQPSSLLPPGCEPISDDDGDIEMADLDMAANGNTGNSGQRRCRQELPTPSNSGSRANSAPTQPTPSSLANQISNATNSQTPSNESAVNLSRPGNKRSLIQRHAENLRNLIMERGYHETLQSWLASSSYTETSDDNDRLESLAYARWCRDWALVFERHGAARVREIFDDTRPRQRSSPGVWNERIIFNAWFDARLQHPGGQRLRAGWVSQSWEAVSNDRAGRIERLSLNGVDDVLYELTSLDPEFVAVFGPQLGPVLTPTSLLLPGRNDSENNTTNEAGVVDNRAQHSTTAVGTTATSSQDGDTPPPPGDDLYDPAFPTTSSPSTAINGTTNDLPPLLQALVVSSPTSKK